ncbi:MAG TPA: hypothetical protein VNM22_21365 [Candidatus Limnocylindrales bacterium]|nr:hypothetical protein [Candidatus Limnocylindrales bacterium]
MQNPSHSTDSEYALIREVLKKLSTTQHSLEERLKALGVILNEEETKSSSKSDPKHPESKKP